MVDGIEACFELLDREVWVVTAAAGSRRGGLLATWVMQAALAGQSPVMVLGLAPNHFTTELVLESGRVAAHLLDHQQADLALNFAIGSGRDRDKLAGLVLRDDRSPPVLTRCRGWLEGRVVARLATGDRVYVWADVIAGGTVGSGSVLRESHVFAAATSEQLKLLRENLRADVADLEPAQQQWRASIPSSLRWFAAKRS